MVPVQDLLQLNFVKVATIIKELFDAGGFTNESVSHFGLGQIEKTSGMIQHGL